MKDDERAFLVLVYRTPRARREFATDLAAGLGIHPRRAAYLLDKWLDKGWWECGVGARTGYLTDAGRAAAEGLLPPSDGAGSPGGG